MWFERFVIIVTSLHRDYLPSSWTMFSPTFVDIGIFIGTIGFFFVLFLLYARTFPVIAQAEVKSILKSSGEKYKKLRAAKEEGREVVATATSPAVKTDLIADQRRINAVLDNVGTFNPGTQSKDNLKEINGIGQIVEEKLNQIGIYTFLQVSKFGALEYALMDKITESSPGRAESEDWATQAQNLIK